MRCGQHRTVLCIPQQRLLADAHRQAGRHLRGSHLPQGTVTSNGQPPDGTFDFCGQMFTARKRFWRRELDSTEEGSGSECSIYGQLIERRRAERGVRGVNIVNINGRADLVCTAIDLRVSLRLRAWNFPDFQKQQVDLPTLSHRLGAERSVIIEWAQDFAIIR